MLVLGRIATADVTAFQAQPQVYPLVAQLHAVFADMFISAGQTDLIGVFANHRALPPGALSVPDYRAGQARAARRESLRRVQWEFFRRERERLIAARQSGSPLHARS